jgi:hypothetical protein
MQPYSRRGTVANLQRAELAVLARAIESGSGGLAFGVQKISFYFSKLHDQWRTHGGGAGSSSEPPVPVKSPDPPGSGRLAAEEGRDVEMILFRGVVHRTLAPKRV